MKVFPYMKKNLHFHMHFIRLVTKKAIVYWWDEHRPVDWWDTLVSGFFMFTTWGFLLGLIGLAVFGFMVTDCS